MQTRIAPVRREGEPTTVGKLSWDEAENDLKSHDYLIPAAVFPKIQKRLRDPSTAEADVDMMIKSGFLHEITQRDPAKHRWRVRWFGLDSSDKPRFCVFDYFARRPADQQWELVHISNALAEDCDWIDEREVQLKY